MAARIVETLSHHRAGIARGLCLVLLVAALVPIAPPFAGRDFPQGHDTAAHLANMFRFDRAWQAGQRPVRWVEGLTPGHGQPLFNFYQVGFFYIVEGIHALGVPLSQSLKAAPVMLWWLASTFVFLWLRPFGTTAAAAGTITFALSPYAIVDVFVRAAYPEFSALVFTCGALWSADAFLRSGRTSRWAIFVLCVAAILVCHLPASLIVAPALVVELVVAGLIVRRQPRRVGALIAAASLAVGLASFYLVPALVELPLIQINELTVGTTDYHNHFVPAWLWTHFLFTYDWNYFGTSVSDITSLMPVHISLVQWVALGVGIGLVAAALVARKRVPHLAHLIGWTLVMAYAMVMMNQVSVGLWDLVPPLRFIQFPWRFFLLISIAGAALTAALVAQITHRTLGVVVAVLVLLFHMHFYDRRLRPDRSIAYADMNIDSPDWTRQLRPGLRELEEPSYDPIGMPRNTAPSGPLTVVGGQAAASTISHSDTDFLANVTSTGASRVQVNIPSFPGWSIRVDKTLQDSPHTLDGYYVVDLRDGHHVVSAHRTSTRVEAVSNWITVASGLALALACGARSRRR
jgi:hypothetical protein